MGNKFRNIFLLALWLFAGCTKEPDRIVYQSEHRWIDRTVAVVYPRLNEMDQRRMEGTAQWFLETFQQAQLFGRNCVKLHIVWYDEQTADIASLSRTLAEDDSIAAIVGPFRSKNLEIFAQACQHTEKPLIAPTVTSEEIIRRYAVSSQAGNDEQHAFLWSLTETDIALSEVLLSAHAAQVQQLYPDLHPTAAVLSPDNIYGKTFFDWIPYQAANLNIQITSNVQYRDDEDLVNRLGNILAEQEQSSTPSSSFCVIEDIGQLQKVARLRRERYLKSIGAKDNPASPDYDALTRAAESTRRSWFSFSYFGQDDLDALSAQELREINYSTGFMPYADPTTGFEISYERRFGTKPSFRECKFFDALLLSALACYTLDHDTPADEEPAPTDNRQLNQLIYNLTLPNRAEDFGASVWTPTALQLFLRSLDSGTRVKFRGASGDIRFDPETSTPATGTTYIHWRILDGKLQILNYFNSSGSHRASVASAAWNYLYDEADALRRLAGQAEDRDAGISYPALTDQYAVLVQASSKFSNYRHLSDVLNVYQHLRKGGFDDEHIILIADRSVADSPENPEPGVVRTRPDGPDLMQGATIDYDASGLSARDVALILTGKSSERLPTVLPQGSGNNVLLYWSGHGHSRENGGADELAWRNAPAGEGFTYELLRETTREMSDAGGFRKMLIVVEACYAEGIVKAIEGIPGILGMTGANAAEQSWADNWNREGNFWMSNRFSCNLADALKARPDITYRDLYLYCAQHTLGSHACLLNAAQFGNLYHNGPAEFILYRN